MDKLLVFLRWKVTGAGVWQMGRGLFRGRVMRARGSDNRLESGSATLSTGYRNALAGARFLVRDLELRAKIIVSENLSD